MASIRKRKGTKNYFACITGPDGKRKQFSTGLSDAKEALAAAVAAERALQANKPTQLHAALRRLADEYAPSEVAATDQMQWLREWPDRLKSKVSKSTYSNYCAAVIPAADWLAGQGIASLDAIATRHIEGLLSHWSGQVSAKTANYKMKLLRIALSQAVQQGFMDRNPTDDIKPLKEARTTRRPFRDSELDLLLASISGEWKALVWLGLNTGQRFGDLASLRWSDIDLSMRTVTLVTNKTGRLVSLPLLPQTLHSLQLIRPEILVDDHVFPVAGRLSKAGRSKAFRSILAKIGLAQPAHQKNKLSPEGKRSTSELSFHSLRHTATSWLKRAGVSDSVAMWRRDLKGCPRLWWADCRFRDGRRLRGMNRSFRMRWILRKRSWGVIWRARNRLRSCNGRKPRFLRWRTDFKRLLYPSCFPVVRSPPHWVRRRKR
ncbi:MAG: tyrosine-type recombinase/integrase [Luteolibacter sp.]